MAFIDTIPMEDAKGEVREMYERQQKPFGYLPNYARVFCYRPEVLQAWANLQETILRTMDTRSYELTTLAAAQAMGSSYCSLAHGRILSENFYSTEELKSILNNTVASPLSEAQKSMMEVARKVATDSSGITVDDIEKLRAEAFSDREIFDIIASAAARCFFAKLVDALGALPDSAFNTMDEALRNELTVGREIASDNQDRI